MKIYSFVKKCTLVLICAAIVYGLGRLYFAVTAGFTIGNITSTLAYDPHWDTHALSSDEKHAIEQALNQEYVYLGRGCQAYVFASLDGNYVIKFFKYQRFRTQRWIDLFTFLPSVNAYQQEKAIEKQTKLHKVFRSWKIAYEYLKEQTGVVFVHLNKSTDWSKQIVIRDKLGLTHQLDLGQMEFLLQRRANMLCPTLEAMMNEGQEKQSYDVLDRLVAMLLSEYAHGFADNDHALMQNTGVLDGNPIHIDVGQFIYNDIVKSPKIYQQELYDKTYKLRQWLEQRYPELAYHLKARLLAILGIDYFYMGPYVHKGDVAKIPHQ